VAVFLLAISLSGRAYGENSLAEWRVNLETVRMLAENSAPKAYREILRLQASMPAETTPADNVRLLNLLARIEIYLAETESSVIHAQLAFDLAKQYKDKTGQSEADVNIAWNAVNQGNIEKMIVADTHNLTILDGVDRPDLLVEAMYRAAMMYMRMENLDQAIAIAVQAKEIAKGSTNEWVLLYANQAMAFSYSQTKRYPEAIEYYQQMHENARQVHSKFQEANALLGMGTAVSNGGENSKGESLIREALKLYYEVEGPFAIAHGLFSLAENLRSQGRVSETLPILNEVVLIYEQHSNKIGLWWTFFQRSTNFKTLGNSQQAQADAERTYELAKAIGFPIYLSKSARLIASIYGSQKRYKQAYEFSVEADKMAARSASENGGLRIVELAKRYETEIRQREIDQLNQRNQEQAGELERRRLQQRWLWTVIVGCSVILLGTGIFLQSVRRTNYRLATLNRQAQQAKNNLQATLDAIPDPLFEIGLDGSFYTYHASRHDPLVISGQPPIGKNLFEVMPANAAAICFSALAEANLKRQSICKQFELAFLTGKVWIELSVAAKPAVFGQQPRFIVISRDITERKNYESVLLQQAELERRQSQFFKIAPGFFFTAVKQADGRYQLPFASMGLYYLFGLQPEEVQDDANLLWNMISPVNIETMLGAADAYETSPETICSEFRIQHPVKHEFWLEMRALPQVVEQDLTIWYGFMLDITERKQAENELRHYKDQLEITVEQRTLELRVAVTAAEAANKAKSTFLANMSHELRTPLNAILGFSNIVRKNPRLPESEQRNIDIIKHSGEHLLSLINDVLEMAKIEAGRVQLEEEPFDLGRMVRRVTEMMRARAVEKGLELVIDQSSQFPRYIIGDEARLSQILINLVANALKFTLQGGVIIRLNTKNNTVSHLLIEVEDSGPGIAESDRQRIFEPFVQLSQLSDSKGTGLGLGITSQFVQLMNGHISIESTLGKGTLFRIDLPLKQVAEGDVIYLNNVEERTVLGVLPGQPKYRILIVEDQWENQVLLANLMEVTGFDVKVASNGKQGVEFFQGWLPDLIWMDRQMPIMDGLAATKAIRALPGGTAVKIIGVSASVLSNQRMEIFDAGMDDFIRKPYHAIEIYECLAKQLGVEFLYADDAKPAVQIELTASMLAILPAQMRHDLEIALINLDNAQIEYLIQQIAEFDPQLQAALMKFADNYNYPAILKVLRSSKE
jgi:PAS domain S-box-containing protein